METLDVPGGRSGLTFDAGNFGLQVLNCIIIFIVILQNDIFNSAGYKKFVTQSDGSMDLLV